MKRLSLSAALLSAAMLFVACNGIEKAASDVAPASAVRTADAARSVNVSQGEAAGIADMFLRTDVGGSMFQTKSSDAQSKRVSTTATVREDGQDMMYVFNYEGGGFVIVGSTRNYYPILAYSDKGSFELQDDMGPVDVWLDETKVSIKNSSSQSAETRAQMQQLWARYDGTITIPSQEELKSRRPQTRSVGEDSCWARIEYLQSQYGSEGWTFTTVRDAEQIFTDLGLSSYYANICYSAEQNHSALNETVIGYKNPVHNIVEPLIGTEWFQDGPFGSLCPNGLAGCGPVAAGQLMYYYKYPANMSWGIYNFTWDDIPDHYLYSNPTKHPHLMRMLGQKFQVNYADSSSTNVIKVANGLDSLGYTASYAPHSTWTAKNEILIFHRPVIMSGTETAGGDGGHMWISEGVHEIIYDAIQYYTENQPYGAGTFTPGMYSIGNPGVEGGSIFYHYFYLNWGWFTGLHNYNGWFASNDVDSGDGNFQYNRYNVYVSHP